MYHLGNERSSVQQPIIKYVSEEQANYNTDRNSYYLHLGWKYVSPEEALNLRGGITSRLFKDVFTKKLLEFNSFLDEVHVNNLINKLERIRPGLEGNLEFWEYLHGDKTVFVPSQNRELNVTLIDTKNIENNEFHVTDEFKYSNGRERPIRADIVFLINGIPVIIVETKSATKVDGIADALDQIRRYHRQTPEFLTLLQVFTLNNLSKFYYGPTWNTQRKALINWREVETDSFETLVKLFFDKKRIIRLIRDYILFTREDNELKKVVLRPHQIRAIEKLIERALDKEKSRGLIWHTQGSGKTYTMIVTAKKLLEHPELEHPTVLMLVDRNELEAQLFSNLEAVGFGHVNVANSKRHLRQLLKNDHRGLIVSTIHKFKDMPANICTRENVFVLIDEAHRTTGGTLGNFLQGALPNATMIGFTGTPIDRSEKGQGTFVMFGRDDPPKGYTDKYSIAESIKDKATVPLNYMLSPNDLQVDRETLNEEFLDLVEAEGVSDIEELNRILDKAVTLKNMLKNSERMNKVAKYVAKHFRENVEPLGYKAFLVAVDREACCFYKEYLDKYLPPEYSEVIISAGHNDPEHMVKYHLDSSREKALRKQFRNPDELPKIFIVTEKLLTGYDAPVLYAMYLDKPMRDHVLLQAIARVNRPYEDKMGNKKKYGLIVDFVGIFANLKKALRFDSADIEGVCEDIEKLKVTFAEMMNTTGKNYLRIVVGKRDDKAIEAIIETFKSEKERDDFIAFFKELSTIYEVISPDCFLRPYLDDYITLAKMYKVVRETFDIKVVIDRELARKTAELVRKNTTTSNIRDAVYTYRIDENTLKLIQKSQVSDAEKVFNLLKSILKYVEEEKDKSPYLIDIGEKAEKIAKSFMDGQQNSREALENMLKVVQEILEAKKKEKEVNLSPEGFTTYWLARERGIKFVKEDLEQFQQILKELPHWKVSSEQGRRIKVELIKVLVKYEKDKEKVMNIARKIIKVLESS